jgi:hypothetical protein
MCLQPFPNSAPEHIYVCLNLKVLQFLEFRVSLFLPHSRNLLGVSDAETRKLLINTPPVSGTVRLLVAKIRSVLRLCSSVFNFAPETPAL